MAKTMTTSAMTDGQIDRACEIFRAKLIKHRFEFFSEAVQQALGDPNLSKEWLGSLRIRVEAVGNMIVRRVHVDRSRTPQDVLDATGRNQYTDKNVVKAMPSGEGKKVEVCFFNLGCFVSDADLEKEYELRGLKPVDPYSLAQVNTDDPVFADDHPNGTHWKDTKDCWCFATFRRSADALRVGVDRGGGGWDGHWWFGGVRK